jgi:antitoxin (DNA-binding transcriptional repressor) of toxin-antitoxin stability system
VRQGQKQTAGRAEPVSQAFRALARRVGVEAGETIEVTDRGRPVAVLAPLPDRGPIERLTAAGDLVPSQHDLDDLPDPLPLGPDQEPPSSVLARLRRDER